MQVGPADCLYRKCIHYQDFKDIGDGLIHNVCKAFPNGIPDEIAFEGNLHTKIFPGQENTILFEEVGE